MIRNFLAAAAGRKVADDARQIFDAVQDILNSVSRYRKYLYRYCSSASINFFCFFVFGVDGCRCFYCRLGCVVVVVVRFRRYHYYCSCRYHYGREGKTLDLFLRSLQHTRTHPRSVSWLTGDALTGDSPSSPC